MCAGAGYETIKLVPFRPTHRCSPLQREGVCCARAGRSSRSSMVGAHLSRATAGSRSGRARAGTSHCPCGARGSACRARGPSGGTRRSVDRRGGEAGGLLWDRRASRESATATATALTFVAFDVLFLDKASTCHLPYEKRWGLLLGLGYPARLDRAGGDRRRSPPRGAGWRRGPDQGTRA